MPQCIRERRAARHVGLRQIRGGGNESRGMARFDPGEPNSEEDRQAVAVPSAHEERRGQVGIYGLSNWTAALLSRGRGGVRAPRLGYAYETPAGDGRRAAAKDHHADGRFRAGGTEVTRALAKAH